MYCLGVSKQPTRYLCYQLLPFVTRYRCHYAPSRSRSPIGHQIDRIRQISTSRILHTTRSASRDQTQAENLIVQQRLNRPVSPHLGIYSWEIMICGALHRNTGILLSGTFYVLGFSYLVLPLMGFPFGSTELISWFGGLSPMVKIPIKWIYGFAFSFHLAHGLRHLIWDTGAMLTNTQVKRTVVAALAFGAVGATGLCWF